MAPVSLRRNPRRSSSLFLGASLALGAALGFSRLGLAQVTSTPGFAGSEAATVWSDAEIERAVLEEMSGDKYGSAGGLRARVKAGIVELLGSTPTVAGKDRALRVAKVVHGVRAVVSRVQVSYARRPDADVARDVKRVLRSEPALAGMPIRTKVSGGIVELDGTIDTWDEQQLAESLALNVVGVRFCQNQLVSSQRGRRSAAALAGDVRSRLNHDPLLHGDPIAISVRGTRARLTGTVGSAREWKRACSLAWVKGMTAVDCDPIVVDTINPPNSNLRRRWPTDREMAATFMEVLAYWPSVSTAGLAVTASSGVLTLSGTTPTASDASALRSIASCVVGVTDVDNQLRGPWWRLGTERVAPPRRRGPRR